MAKEYTEQKVIIFEGRHYNPKGNGYYYNCTTRKHLHQAIWISHNGPIPDGYEIHHIDFNKENNDISNLACITKEEHHKIHKDALTEERRQKMRDNMRENALPKAIEWHKSEKSKEWHKEHMKKQHERGCFKKELICSNCGKTYIGKSHSNSGNHFCCNNCKSQFRRKNKIDWTEERVCIICGNKFMTYPKSNTCTCSHHCANIVRARTIKERTSQ